MTCAPWQVMPPLSADEYQALKADIALRGVMVPVEYDQDGVIIDGHHRVRACQELGLTDWPRIARTYESEADRHRLPLHPPQSDPERGRPTPGRDARRQGEAQAVTVLAIDPFASLGADAAASVAEVADEPLDKPVPVCPVPDDAPAPSFRHPSYGEPAAVWTCRDAGGRTLGYVARFDTSAGKQ